MDVEYTGAVEERDGAAWYKFTTGENISVYRFWVWSGNTTNCTYLKVYDADGAIVDKIEVYPSHEDTGFLDLYLDSGKEYAFAIKAAAPVDFKIRVSERICDAGTDQNSAVELSLNVRHTVIADSTMRDWFVFTVPETGIYKLTVYNVDVGAKIRWEADGITGFAENEDSGISNIDVNKDERIYIKVYSNKQEANGTYILQIEKKD